MYYLNSRYYDPELCRFISADSLAVPTISPGSASWDKNLYAYCENDPVNRKDAGGGCWQAVAIGFGFGIIGQYVSDVIGNIQSGKTGMDIIIPNSSLGDYFAAGLGGAIAAIPIGGAFGAITFGAVGSVTTDRLQGKINSNSDLAFSATIGGTIGGIGHFASNFVASVKVKKINGMSRFNRKVYIRDKIYKSPQGEVNINLHKFDYSSNKEKISILMDYQYDFKVNIYSTTASTVLSTASSAANIRRFFA